MALDFLNAFLEDNPDILYGGMFRNLRSPSPNFTDYWRNKSGSVYGDYLSRLGQTALGGEIPTQTYQDYLGGNPWLEDWGKMSPSFRGQQGSRFSSGLKWQI